MHRRCRHGRIPAGSARVALAGAIAGDSMPDQIELAEAFFDIVDAPGVFALIAAHGFSRVQLAYLAQARRSTRLTVAEASGDAAQWASMNGRAVESSHLESIAWGI